MKRILFFHEVFPCGGAERVTIDIANYLSGYGMKALWLYAIKRMM